jgi:hypothetical protein
MSATPFPRARGQPWLVAVRRRREAADEVQHHAAPAAPVNPPGRAAYPPALVRASQRAGDHQHLSPWPISP